MRIIAGEARGRRLTGPKGDATRPMTDRAREAIFNILAVEVVDARVLDLYAGTGSMGLEALSRGAASATFVESNRSMAEILSRNVDAVGLGGEVVVSTVERYLAGPVRGPADLAFVDPPYPLDVPSVQQVLADLDRHLAPGGIVLLHRRTGEPAPEAPWPLVDERTYGSAQLWFYRDERTP
jgi:16S rRNA (guanine966-N2)-methyltransferase